MYDVIIVGGGVAGFSAAMYAGRLKLKTLVLAKARGGAIILTNEIANWPGIKKTDGLTLAKQVEEHALEYGIEVQDIEALEAAKAKGGFSIKAANGREYEGRALIIAAGGEHRRLGVPGEEQFVGRGVHTCALCDGFFYKGKDVAVIGGSDSAAKEALLLAQWAKKVCIIYRREKVRAEPVTCERMHKAAAEGRMEIIHNTNVVEIRGAKRVSSLVFDKPYKGSVEFPIDGVFVEIGREPQSNLAKMLGAKINGKGEIEVDREGATNVKGVFAAGDVIDSRFKQAITAAAGGVAAAYSAYEYLQGKK